MGNIDTYNGQTCDITKLTIMIRITMRGTGEEYEKRGSITNRLIQQETVDERSYFAEKAGIKICQK